MCKAVKVVRTDGLSRTEWLEYRRAGIGGSDAATVVGLGRFGSQFELWSDKKGLLPDKEDTEVMRLGRDLEQYVAQRWMEKTGKRVRRMNYILRDPRYPYSLANLDREVIGEDAGLECKTTSVYNKCDWEGGEIPPAWYVQCMHYMAVCGFDRMYLAVLVLSKGFYTFEIERDEAEIAALMEAETVWWERYMTGGEEPPADGSDSAGEVLRKLHPVDDGTSVLLMDKEDDLDRIGQLSSQIEALTQERDALKQGIMQRMGEAGTGQSAGWKVTWKAQESRRVDQKKLKEAYPEAWEACVKVSTSRPMRIVRTGN